MANKKDDNYDESNDLEIVDLDNPDDEFGYTDADWEEFDEKEVELHDRVISMNAPEVDAALVQHSSHLVRWAVAQVYADAEDFDVFDDIALSIVAEPWDHAGIDYEEIAAELFIDACLEEDDARSRSLIKVVADNLGENDLEVARMRAFQAMVFEDRDTGLEAYQRLIDKFEDEPELSVQVAYDFILFGEFDLAQELLEDAENQALMIPDAESVAIIREAVETLQAAREESENQH